MKNDKAATPGSKEKKNPGSRTAGNTNKSRSGITSSDSTPAVTEKTKARSGRGLANEGTIVSYDEER